MNRIVKTAAAAIAGVGALGACTPEEVQLWQAWHAQDPAGAEAFVAAPEADATSEPHGVWDQLADCESGGNWAINTGNGYSGGLQFLPSTWRAYGGSGMPHEASRDEQIRVAENVRADVGFGAWPACSRKLGLL